MIASKQKRASGMKMSEAVTPEPSLYHRLHSVLHAVRSIAHFEDALCEMTQEAKVSGVLSGESIAQLTVILKTIPALDYVHELEGLGSARLEADSPRRSQVRRRAGSGEVSNAKGAAKKSSTKKSSNKKSVKKAPK